MEQQDALQSFVFKNRAVRGELVCLDASFKEIIEQHDYPMPINILLGEALAATTLLSGIIKMPGRLTVQFQGEGALTLLTASCTEQYHVRGLAQCSGDLTPHNLFDALSKGQLAITFQPNKGPPYQGIVEFQNNSIARAIEIYFHQSEQLPSHVFLGVDEGRAYGFFLQILPGEESAHDDWQYVTSMAKTLALHDMVNLDEKTLLHRLFHEDDLLFFPGKSVMFRCTCSKLKSKNAIRLMGRAEAESILTDKHAIGVTCEFCNRHYEYTKGDIPQIFTKI